MPVKPKHNYAPNENVGIRRDTFQTPNHASRLLFPYFPDHIEIVWECAAGPHKIVDVMKEKYYVFSSDIILPEVNNIHNFLIDPIPDELILDWNATCIITNPPFSLKRQFFYKCLEYKIPFALLIPFDMAGWLWDGFKKYNCQGIVPNRRINYITPTGKSGKNSSSQFHSFWLCKDFNIPNQFEFVELTKEMMEDI